MVATLLDAGHGAAVLDGYSIEEIEAHYHAHMRLRAKLRLEMITDMSVASGAVKRTTRQRHVRYLAGTARRLFMLREEQKKPQMTRLFEGLAKVKRRERPVEENEDGNS